MMMFKMESTSQQWHPWILVQMIPNYSRDIISATAQMPTKGKNI